MTAHSAEETEALRDRWLRCVADLENLQKRTARAIERETDRAHQTTLLDFLEVIDSLERALAIGGIRDDENAWYQGMKAIHKQMLDTLQRQGARPFDSLGERFDPHRHDAISCVVNEELEAGTVVQVMKTGYEMSDGRLLRAAEVITTQRNHHDG
ncbi:MAG: nucleotide exchange factor GrpE [Planctomycetes bacterium]|nr:nucleotide exchange factor GrpE [Planctomycetota bacterium]